MMVGAGHTASEVANAKFGEVLVYNRYMDDEEEAQLVAHLQNKWNPV